MEGVAAGDSIHAPGVETSADLPVILSLVVKADGKICEAGDNEKAIPEKQLAKDLAEAARLNPSVRVIISADKTVNFSKVVQLLETVSASGIENVEISNKQKHPRSVITSPKLPGLSKMPATAARGSLSTTVVEADTETKMVRVRDDLVAPRSEVVVLPIPSVGTVSAAEVIVRDSATGSGVLPRPSSGAGSADTSVAPARGATNGVTEIFGGPSSGLANVAQFILHPKAEADTTRSVSFRLAVPKAGIVKELKAKEGTKVKRGDILLKLDASQAEAALKVAEIRVISLEREAAVKAELLKKRIHLLKQQVEAGQTTNVEYANAMAEAKQLGTETEFAVAKAQLDQARVALSQYQVVAPVAGTIQAVVPNLGEYVSPETPVILLRVVQKPVTKRRAPIEVVPERPKPVLPIPAEAPNPIIPRTTIDR